MPALALVNIRFLIDRLVQHQAELLAELATSGGVRAPLAELSDQLFIHLAEELDSRGVSRKVSADMFGMALRAYQKKLHRLAKSSTENGSSLWQAVLEYLKENKSATRAQILQRFCRDDEAQLRAVLHDLTENGLTTMAEAGPQTRYQLAEVTTERLESTDHFADLLWLFIFREGPISAKDLSARNQRRKEQFETTIELLMARGRVVAFTEGDEIYYGSNRFEVASGKDGGWEAAILDHVHALVRTVIGVLPGLSGRGSNDPNVGGFTYALDVWPGHPLEEEVTGTLHELRRKLSDLRKRVDQHNETASRPVEFHEVRIYGGQSITPRKRAGDTIRPPAGKPP